MTGDTQMLRQMMEMMRAMHNEQELAASLLRERKLQYTPPSENTTRHTFVEFGRKYSPMAWLV